MELHEDDARIRLTLALLAAAIVAYLPSFNAWFFLDDFRIILENEALHDVFDPAAIWAFSKARFIASLSLAANYTLHGENVFGYHLVNFLIHIGAGAALFWLLRALLAAPAMAGNRPEWMRWIPWIAVAIFLLHPLQTQAVTYIVQRYSSLMAMFYLAAMASYAWARLRGSLPLYLLALACTLLAMLSKQTAATLPLALLLVELLFFRRLSARQWAITVAAGVAGAVFAAWLMTLPALDIVGLTRETDQIRRIDYLATQMEVLWRYIGLFFLIGPQRLEYEIAIADGFAEISTVVFALGHVAVVATGLALWRRRPLISFGLVFYYLAHLVESSFLPIIDEAFEHRTYLPNAGLAAAVAVALAWLSGHLTRYRAGTAVTLVLLAGLATATWARNSLWADQIEFLRHETRVSPDSERAWTSLGKELMREMQFEEALETLKNARRIAIDKRGGNLRPPTILNMIFALHYTGRNEEAIALANGTETAEFNRTELGFFHEARGRARLALDRFERARADLERAAELNPTANVIAFLAAAEYGLGNHTRARRLARGVLETSPNHPLARKILQRTR